jgi:hypothetical protein
MSLSQYFLKKQKRCHLNFFLNPNHTFTGLRVVFGPPNQLGHQESTLMAFNFKLKLGKELGGKV